MSHSSRWGCHGIPERCFKWKGRPMPICARCVGADLGHVAALALTLAGWFPGVWACLGLLGICLVDWSLQTFLGIMSTNPRRLVTGLAGGLGVGLLIWRSLWLAAAWLLAL